MVGDRHWSREWQAEARPWFSRCKSGPKKVAVAPLPMCGLGKFSLEKIDNRLG